MDAQLPIDASPLQTATAAIQIQAEKLGHNEDWKSFKTENNICKFYFDPKLADKLMEAGQSNVVRDFIKAEISDNNSFVANSNIKDLNKNSEIKEIFKQESIAKSGWDWTSETENNEAFKQRSAITLGATKSNTDEFKEMFGGSKEKTPTLSSLESDKQKSNFNASLDEFNELFGKNDSRTEVTPTLSSLESEKQKASANKYKP